MLLDQKQRFLKQVEARENGDEEAQWWIMISSMQLEIGLPPTGGMGIGVDRLIMYLTNRRYNKRCFTFPNYETCCWKDSE